MKPIEDGYQLSTGKSFYANNGILGITHTDPSVCSEGYDGGVMESEPRESWMDEAAESFTTAERAEIAAYMICLWATFGDIQVDLGPTWARPVVEKD